jgi:hypothetical protein
MLGMYLALRACLPSDPGEVLPAQLTLLAPFAVGVMVVALGWLFFGSKSHDDSPGADKVCINCGSSILDDWRICPDCGRFIESSDGSETVTSPSACGGLSDSKPSF